MNGISNKLKKHRDNEKKVEDDKIEKEKLKEEAAGDAVWYDNINECFDRLLDGITAYKYNYTNNYVKKIKLELDVSKTKLMYTEVEQNLPDHSSTRSKSKKEERSLSPETV